MAINTNAIKSHTQNYKQRISEYFFIYIRVCICSSGVYFFSEISDTLYELHDTHCTQVNFIENHLIGRYICAYLKINYKERKKIYKIARAVARDFAYAYFEFAMCNAYSCSCALW